MLFVIFLVKFFFIIIILEMLIFRFLLLGFGKGYKSFSPSDVFKNSRGEKEGGDEEGWITMNSILLRKRNEYEEE